LKTHKIVLEKVKNILEEAGIFTNQKIVVKTVRGEDDNPVFRIDSGRLSYALKNYLLHRKSITVFYTGDF
jgi:hypothetical protein